MFEKNTDFFLPGFLNLSKNVYTYTYLSLFNLEIKNEMFLFPPYSNNFKIVLAGSYPVFFIMAHKRL